MPTRVRSIVPPPLACSGMACCHVRRDNRCSRGADCVPSNYWLAISVGRHSGDSHEHLRPINVRVDRGTWDVPSTGAARFSGNAATAGSSCSTCTSRARTNSGKRQAHRLAASCRPGARLRCRSCRVSLSAADDLGPRPTRAARPALPVARLSSAAAGSHERRVGVPVDVFPVPDVPSGVPLALALGA